MTSRAHIAAHLEEARKAQTQEMHDLWTELAEDEMDALVPRVRIPLGIDLAIEETCAMLFPAEKERMN
jgi:hypothetical protein